MPSGVYKRTKEHNWKISQANLKNPVKYWLGKKRPPISEEWRKKLSKAKKGEKNSQWLGGKSFEPYNPKFNNDLKRKIRKRDNYICQLCDKTEKEVGRRLSIHHIDYNKKNCKKNNLITLCCGCNNKVNFSRLDWMNYFKKRIANEHIRQKLTLFKKSNI